MHIIPTLCVLANRKDESLKLSDKEMCSLQNYIYQLSQIDQLEREGKGSSHCWFTRSIDHYQALTATKSRKSFKFYHVSFTIRLLRIVNLLYWCASRFYSIQR